MPDVASFLMVCFSRDPLTCSIDDNDDDPHDSKQIWLPSRVLNRWVGFRGRGLTCLDDYIDNVHNINNINGMCGRTASTSEK